MHSGQFKKILQLFDGELDAKSLMVMHQFCYDKSDGVHAVLSGGAHVLIASMSFRDAAVTIAPRVLWAGSVYDPRSVELFAFLEFLGVGSRGAHSNKPMEFLKQEVASYRGARKRINEFFDGDLTLSAWRDVMNSRWK